MRGKRRTKKSTSMSKKKLDKIFKDTYHINSKDIFKVK